MLRKTHANSLSMLSPNPGVSTIVRAMRTPSSSNSTKKKFKSPWLLKKHVTRRRTDVHWFDFDSFFHMSCVWVVGNLVREDLRLAKSIHKSCSPRSRSAWTSRKNGVGGAIRSKNHGTRTNHHDGELDTLLDLVTLASCVRHGWRTQRQTRTRRRTSNRYTLKTMETSTNRNKQAISNSDVRSHIT